MQRKGIELSISTVAIVLFALIVAVFATFFVLRSQKAMSLFRTKTQGAGGSDVTSFNLQCKYACDAADGDYTYENRDGFEYCSETIDTSGKGGIEEDHCYGEDGDIINVSCKIETKGGNNCILTNGCKDCG